MMSFKIEDNDKRGFLQSEIEALTNLFIHGIALSQKTIVYKYPICSC
jgi:hypothetical protein